MKNFLITLAILFSLPHAGTSADYEDSTSTVKITCTEGDKTYEASATVNLSESFKLPLMFSREDYWLIEFDPYRDGEGESALEVMGIEISDPSQRISRGDVHYPIEIFEGTFICNWYSKKTNLTIFKSGNLTLTLEISPTASKEKSE